MSVDDADGRTNCKPTNEQSDDTQHTENDRGRSGQATSVDRTGVSNDTYTSQRHKFTERKYSTGLRHVDGHASWRDVYRACHVGVGVK